MCKNPTDITLHNEEELLKKELNEALANEESHRQKIREAWLKLGDKEFKFFYAFLKSRQAHNNLNHLLKPDGTSMENIEDIKHQAPLYFERLFNQGTYWSSFPDIIVKKKLTKKASSWLIREVTDI